MPATEERLQVAFDAAAIGRLRLVRLALESFGGRIGVEHRRDGRGAAQRDLGGKRITTLGDEAAHLFGLAPGFLRRDRTVLADGGSPPHPFRRAVIEDVAPDAGLQDEEAEALQLGVPDEEPAIACRLCGVDDALGNSGH